MESKRPDQREEAGISRRGTEVAPGCAFSAPDGHTAATRHKITRGSRRQAHAQFGLNTPYEGMENSRGVKIHGKN